MSSRYPVAIVGKQHYQRAIAAIGEADDVVLLHEPDNPYDDRAIAVVCHGDTIGYLPRDCWLARALIDEGKPVSARVARLSNDEQGIIGVTIEARLPGEPLRDRSFQRR